MTTELKLDSIENLRTFAENHESHYVVQVELDGNLDIQGLKHELQWAYDQGAEGFFVIEHKGGNTVVGLLRSNDDEAGDYIMGHMLMKSLSVQKAALHQLALELDADPVNPLSEGLADKVVGALQRHHATIYDPKGALDSVAHLVY